MIQDENEKWINEAGGCVGRRWSKKDERKMTQNKVQMRF